MIWFSIFISGLITYLLRASTLVLIKREYLNDDLRVILSYVPSAIFPAIIFPAIFINEDLSFIKLHDPKFIAAIVAIFAGYFSKNVIVTITFGMISFWLIKFVLS